MDDGTTEWTLDWPSSRGTLVRGPSGEPSASSARFICVARSGQKGKWRNLNLSCVSDFEAFTKIETLHQDSGYILHQRASGLG